MAERRPFGLALVGAGAFGAFCLDSYSTLPEVQIRAVVDTNLARAEELAALHSARAYDNLNALLDDADVSIVHVSTPPSSHGPQGMAVLGAGKHLFCEKPLALTVQEGEALLRTARENRVFLTVNYVMRHNPFWAAVAALTRNRTLGELRHIDLANHAAGLSLPPDHWFWDPSISGGIWVEHGVHFFDAFAWATGTDGTAVCGQLYQRGDGRTDRVEGLFQYGTTAVHCYHAFDKSSQTEQTTVRLTFDGGYVTLREWVPTSLELDTWVEPEKWRELLPGEITVSLAEDGRTFAVSRLKEDKPALYRRSIQAGMQDLVQAAGDPDHRLAVTGELALASLKTAIDAGGSVKSG
jgi:predicted dehydrogenase